MTAALEKPNLAPAKSPDQPFAPAPWPRAYRLTLWGAFAVYAAWFLWNYATRSLWVDEIITAWVTSADLETCINRALEFQGQSPVYFSLVWGVRQLLGDSEFALRSISLFATAGSVIVFHKILKGLNLGYDAWAGTLIVAVVLLTDMEVTLNTRPYALAIFFSLLAFHSLLRWLEMESWRALALYVFAVSATIVFHYLFATLASFHLLAVLYFTSDSKKRLAIWGLAWVCVLAALIPFAPHLMSIAEKAKLYSFAAPPTLFSTIRAIFSAEIILLLIIGLSFGLFLRPRGQIKAIPKSAGWIGLFWWVAGPVGIGSVFVLTGISFNVSRYILWRLPALGLLTALVVRVVYPHRLVALPLAIVLIGNSFKPGGDILRWREAIAWGRTHTDETYQTVLYPGLIEMSSEEWLKRSINHGYLRSPLTIYDWDRDIEVLPGYFPETGEYFDEKLQEFLNDHDRIIFFLRLYPADFSSEIEQKSLHAGFKIEASRKFGPVHVLVVSK